MNTEKLSQRADTLLTEFLTGLTSKNHARSGKLYRDARGLIVDMRQAEDRMKHLQDALTKAIARLFLQKRLGLAHSGDTALIAELNAILDKSMGIAVPDGDYYEAADRNGTTAYRLPK